MYKKLFTELAEKRWGWVDLNRFAKLTRHQYSSPNFTNPFLDPVVCSKWVDGIHKFAGIDYSYGGYLENRANLWEDGYMMKANPPRPVHLGVDYNVPAGTIVYSPFDGKIIDVMKDNDTDGGWGGRLIIQLDKYPNETLLLAHLSHAGLRKKGKVKAGVPVGTVGTYPENGNWFPHLHAQIILLTKKEVPQDIDGYAAVDDYDKFMAVNPESVMFYP